MIVSVTTPAERQCYLAALDECAALGAQLEMRLALFGALAGSGWQFYTAVPDAGQDPAPLAIALRGDAATVMGAFDPEELGSFLRFMGVRLLTTPSATPPQGYALWQQLFVYTLGAGQALPLPPFTGAMAGQESAVVLDPAPSLTQILPLLFGDGAGTALPFAAAGAVAASPEDTALQEQYYADNTLARNYGMAEFWLLRHGGTPIFTLGASAVVGQIAYLSAGETLASYRGQGIGGHYIATMANEYAAKGYTVCFVCETVRCGFYQRLGFAPSGVLCQYRAVE